MRDFHFPGRSAVYATNGMCASSHPLASKVAVQILEAGGSAVDAAIAAAVLLGICEPQSTGIGGDCFVLLDVPNSDKIIALNGSGRSPLGLDAEKLRAGGLSSIPLGSVESVNIPGAIDAFCRLSKDYGKLGLKASLAPAIYYAETGVPVAPRAGFDWGNNAKRLTGDARKFYLNNGEPFQAGDVFRAPEQAKVLREIALHGRDGFYLGKVAEDMVASLNAMGGAHTLDDFAAIQCEYTTPISSPYKGVELVEHPPNGQGATALLILNMLKHFDLDDLDPFGAKRAHIEAEITKLAYGARNKFIADFDYATRVEHMLALETAENLANLISLDHALDNPSTTSGAAHKDTVCLSVVDKDGMSVSLIYSIFHAFGSGLASSKYGINFQNRGAGFTLEKGHPNEAAGGKRSMHTIIPAMLKQNGAVIMSFGVMGGAYQANGHARFVSNLVDFDLDIQTAIDAPRCFADIETGTLNVERGYSDQVRNDLTELGHNVVTPGPAIGGAQAIQIDHENGVLIGASDPRKDGCALGY